MGKTKRVKTTVPPELKGIDASLYRYSLERVQVIKDGSCLFRAVAQQYFGTQEQHVVLRRKCADYIKSNHEDFKEFLGQPVKDYVKNLQSPDTWGGEPEIVALHRILRRDIVIIKEEPNGKIIKKAYSDSSVGRCNPIRLVLIGNEHYDSAYSRGWTGHAAVCQSVLTDLLYQNVFKVDTPTPSNVDKTLSKLPPSQPHPQEGEGYPFSRDVLQLLSPTNYRNIATEIFETNKQAQEDADHSMALAFQDTSPVFNKGSECEVKIRKPRDGLTIWVKGHINLVGNQKYTVYVPYLKKELMFNVVDMRPVKRTTDPTGGGTSKRTTDPTSGDTSKRTTDPTGGGTSKRTTDPTSGGTSKRTTDPTSGGTSKRTTDPTSGDTSKRTTDPTSGDTSKKTTDSTGGGTSKRTTDPTSGGTSKKTSDPTGDGTSKKTTNPTSGGTNKRTSATDGVKVQTARNKTVRTYPSNGGGVKSRYKKDDKVKPHFSHDSGPDPPLGRNGGTKPHLKEEGGVNLLPTDETRAKPLPSGGSGPKPHPNDTGGPRPHPGGKGRMKPHQSVEGRVKSHPDGGDGGKPRPNNEGRVKPHPNNEGGVKPHPNNEGRVKPHPNNEGGVEVKLEQASRCPNPQGDHSKLVQDRDQDESRGRWKGQDKQIRQQTTARAASKSTGFDTKDPPSVVAMDTPDPRQPSTNEYKKQNEKVPGRQDGGRQSGSRLNNPKSPAMAPLEPSRGGETTGCHNSDLVSVLTEPVPKTSKEITTAQDRKDRPPPSLGHPISSSSSSSSLCDSTAPTLPSPLSTPLSTPLSSLAPWPTHGLSPVKKTTPDPTEEVSESSHFTSVLANLPPPPLSDFYDGKFSSHEQFFAEYGQKCFDVYCDARPTAREMFESISPPCEWPDIIPDEGKEDRFASERTVEEDNDDNCSDLEEVESSGGGSKPSSTPDLPRNVVFASDRPILGNDLQHQSHDQQQQLEQSQQQQQQQQELLQHSSSEVAVDKTQQESQSAPVEGGREGASEGPVKDGPSCMLYPPMGPLRGTVMPYYGVPAPHPGPFYPFYPPPNWGPNPYMHPSMMSSQGGYPPYPPYFNHPLVMGISPGVRSDANSPPPKQDEVDSNKEVEATSLPPPPEQVPPKSDSPRSSPQSTNSDVLSNVTSDKVTTTATTLKDEWVELSNVSLSEEVSSPVAKDISSSEAATTGSESDYQTSTWSKPPSHVKHVQDSKQKGKSYSQTRAFKSSAHSHGNIRRGNYVKGSLKPSTLSFKQPPDETDEMEMFGHYDNSYRSKVSQAVIPGSGGHIDYDVGSDDMSPTAQQRSDIDNALSQYNMSREEHFIESFTLGKHVHA